ncbi:MAG: 5-bromo-4-chloroindolyl phosphate hydrolysis family protein [Lachnospiraceae bacterium]|nr:5-bromo-4-chloroindolyl phosphate hydrolysis family protein [Lachnospiraceae bacterium]
MKNGGNYGWLLPLGLIIGAAALIGNFKGLLLTGGLVLGGLLILTAVILFIALKVSGDEAKNAPEEVKMSPEDAAVYQTARKDLTELRVLNARLKESEIRSESNEICAAMEKILSALKEDPTRIASAQMFLQYYLPTQKNILTKYHQIVSSGVSHGDLKEKVMNHLADIKTATDKQLLNVFEDDMLDISAEMELMSTSIKQDGLM